MTEGDLRQQTVDVILCAFEAGHVSFVNRSRSKTKHSGRSNGVRSWSEQVIRGTEHLCSEHLDYPKHMREVQGRVATAFEPDGCFSDRTLETLKSGFAGYVCSVMEGVIDPLLKVIYIQGKYRYEIGELRQSKWVHRRHTPSLRANKRTTWQEMVQEYFKRPQDMLELEKCLSQSLPTILFRSIDVFLNGGSKTSRHDSRKKHVSSHGNPSSTLQALPPQDTEAGVAAQPSVREDARVPIAERLLKATPSWHLVEPKVFLEAFDQWELGGSNQLALVRCAPNLLRALWAVSPGDDPNDCERLTMGDAETRKLLETVRRLFEQFRFTQRRGDSGFAHGP